MERFSQVIAVGLIVASIYFFLLGVNLMVRLEVLASLLSVMIGFVLLSYGVNLLRAYLVTRAAWTSKKQEGGEVDE